MTEYLKINSFVFFIVSILFGCNSQNSSKTLTKENANKGEKLFNTVGCPMCHSVSGETKYGPSLNNILNTNVCVIRKGEKLSLTIDREYIRRSIQNPDYEKVINFQNRRMPKPELSPEEIEYIIDYLISVSEH